MLCHESFVDFPNELFNRLAGYFADCFSMRLAVGCLLASSHMINVALTFFSDFLHCLINLSLFAISPIFFHTPGRGILIREPSYDAWCAIKTLWIVVALN